jgi:hypothetical protein
VINKLSAEDLFEDIYYQHGYACLYEANAEIFEYCFREGELYVSFKSLKRRISYVASIKVDDELYDLETPYGYGGPISNSDNEGFLSRAFDAYKAHCIKHKIVCEFIRLHPFNPIVEKAKLFDMHRLNRHVVVVDLSLPSVMRRKLYSKTTRNIVKRAYERLTVENDGSFVPQFIELYNETMLKNKAEDFYFFKPEYFSSLVNLKGVSLLAVKFEESLVSMGFIMCGKDIAHYHLSANNTELNKENGNYIMLDSGFEYARSQGCKYMVLGGGRTSSVADSLLAFKSKFSKTTMPFFIAGLDHLPDKRRMLNKLWSKHKLNDGEHSPNIFQLYRIE